MKVALIAPPWPLFNRPSIQIAALKAYLGSRLPDAEISSYHPYLALASSIGFDVYQKISESNWASEAVCAGILFPDMARSCDRLFLKTVERRSVRTKDSLPDPQAIRKTTAAVLDDFVSSADFGAFGLIGLSVSINQLTSALVIARAVKARIPSCPVVFGGAGVSGGTGVSLIKSFPEVDYVINGEGERPLAGLVDFLSGRIGRLPGGVYGKDVCAGLGGRPAKDQIKDMDSLPPPDFDDYFNELSRLPPERRFFPVLPVEFSRGCWWGRCSFCNLNLQWTGYRAKSTERMANEIGRLSRRYGLIDFAFMDNCLPLREASGFFDMLRAHGRDYGFFAELRAAHGREDMAVMARGGLRQIQAGIEALSQSLLERLNKGAKVMDNVAMMRHAEEAGLSLCGNLILHFPESTDEEVEETLQALEFVWPFKPLKPVSFWLGMGSPVSADPAGFGIKSVSCHPYWNYLFPAELRLKMSHLVLGYRGDRLIQKRRWRLVEERLVSWQAGRDRLGPVRPLTYRDGGDFLLVRQLTPSGKVLMHRLKGHSRVIYLFCLEPRPMQPVFDQAPGRPRHEIYSFLRGLVAKRLMFEHGGRFLSLAIAAGDRLD